MKRKPIVIAIDGTSASGKSTNAKRVAAALGYTYVDTGAMYRTFAWYCVQQQIDLEDVKAITATLKKWKTRLVCTNKAVYLTVDGYHPAKEIRTSATSAAVPKVAAIPAVRSWMKKVQRECVQFGNIVMEGRDIGSAIFPETEFKFYLDASLDERSRRREADGVIENLAERDKKDTQRAVSPLVISLGATLINTSKLTPDETTAMLLEEIHAKLTKKNLPS
ncbi:MAG TPA: (d)CMP kinase [Verrucomicrobiota bacterium]|jgi:cytidylate kinase|nr:(d)CMP kinase [Verrucomicrobiota bacterium]